MLADMIDNLLNAKDYSQREKAFASLGKLGVDRTTAKVMAAERKRMQKEEKPHGRNEDGPDQNETA